MLVCARRGASGAFKTEQVCFLVVFFPDLNRPVLNLSWHRCLLPVDQQKERGVKACVEPGSWICTNHPASASAQLRLIIKHVCGRQTSTQVRLTRQIQPQPQPDCIFSPYYPLKRPVGTRTSSSRSASYQGA